MNKINLLILTIILTITSCSNPKMDENHFSATDEILKLKTVKHQGCGLFSAGAGSLHFQAPNENHYGLDFKLPQGVGSIQVATKILDIKPAIYKGFKARGDTVSFNYSVKKFNLDTTNIPKQEIKQNYLSILRGIVNDSTIMIVDQNNNWDFSDDTVRAIEPMQWKSVRSLIGFDYQIFNGQEIVADHSWMNIGYSRSNDNLLCFVSQHVSSTFHIDDNSYTIAVSDGQWNCSFDDINLALIEENGIRKDTLIAGDYLKRGEYLNLGNQYYKFENIANDGSNITLVKEDNFASKTGTQIGMIAPDFKCHTTQGDTVSLKDYKDNYLLLTNVSACWSPVSSYTCHKDMYMAYSQKIDFLGIDNSPGILNQNIKNLSLTGKFIIAEDNNYSIQKNYRPDYCSWTCFLISPEGRIVDKFEIFDWKERLSNYFAANEKNKP